MVRRPLRGVPLRWRLFALLVLLALLNVVDTGLTVANDERLQSQERLEQNLNRAGRVEERLRGDRDGQLIELRGYVPTADPTFLRNYRRLRRDEQVERVRMRRLLAEEPDMLVLADRVRAALDRWRREAAVPVIAAVQNGQMSRANAIISDVGEPLVGAERAAADAFSARLDSRLAEVERQIEAGRTRLNRQLLTTSVLALITVVISAWAIRRWITLPVDSLSTQVGRVAAGTLKEPVHGSGPPELEHLGQDVERMRRRIVDELDQSRRAVEALEQNAPLVASLRSQLRATTNSTLPEGLRVVGRIIPADGMLAGDWYDVISVDATRVTLVVVDVSGHGAEAGLRALWLKHLISPALMMGLAPGETLNWVASEIGDTGEWFATCVIIEIDARTGHCRYANAGHPPPLIVGRDRVVRLPATGTLFGGLPRQRWQTAETRLAVGETLAVYTDGITESRDARGDMFGDHRLVSCFRSATTRDPGRLADHVMHQVHAFGPDRLKDDATLALVTLAAAEEDTTTGA